MTDLRTLSRRFVASLREDGVPATVMKCVRFPFVWAAERRNAKWLARVTREQPPEAVFAEIYRRNHWGNPESVSGYGSTLDNTASLRRSLEGMLRDFGIESIYDAPCGDFNWMRAVVRTTEVAYCGVDIVPALIETNQRRYQGPRRTFAVADITRDPFPAADLWICRDCFFHLSYADISRALHNFVRSEIPYVLMTTYVNEGRFMNRDIRTGDFRMIDLFTAPLSLPRDVKYRIDDTPIDDSPREMCLWTREQIAEALPALDQAIMATALR